MKKLIDFFLVWFVQTILYCPLFWLNREKNHSGSQESIEILIMVMLPVMVVLAFRNRLTLNVPRKAAVIMVMLVSNYFVAAVIAIGFMGYAI